MQRADNDSSGGFADDAAGESGGDSSAGDEFLELDLLARLAADSTRGPAHVDLAEACRLHAERIAGCFTTEQRVVRSVGRSILETVRRSNPDDVTSPVELWVRDRVYEVILTEFDIDGTIDELQKLAAAAQQGDRRALEMLFARLDPIVHHIARRIFHVRFEYDDAAQEAGERLFTQFSTYGAKAPVVAWARAVVVNSCYRSYARFKRQPVPTSWSTLDGPTDARTSVIAGRRIEIFERLEPLDHDERELVLLRHLAGMSIREVTEWKFDGEINPKNERLIRRRSHDAREKMRATIRPAITPGG